MKETIQYIGWRQSGDKPTYIEKITEDRGDEFKGIIVKHGYVTKYGSGSQKKGWFRVNNSKNIYPKSGITWETGTVKLDIATTIGESSEMSLLPIIEQIKKKLKF